MKFEEADIRNNLYISQSLPTIQGEGSKSGEPSYLIRLAYCNLKCPWCDSKYSWKYKEDLPGSTIINKNTFSDWIYAIETLCLDKFKINNIMITGGEPLLYMKNLLFIKLLTELRFNTIEIETNGILIDQFNKHVLQHLSYANANRYSNIKLNISPKIDPKCYPSEKEFKKQLTKIKRNIKDIQYEYELKFVHDRRIDDVKFNNIINEFKISKNNIIIMPLTPIKTKATSHAEFMYYYVKENCLPTLNFCMKYGYKFSPRIHTFLFEDHLEDLGEN